MTIKQQGGIFGRNPTFNNVTVDGTLTVDQIAEKTGAAGITLDGVTLKDGNVVLADGKGIDFSATAGTGTSELFDDYEEGTWTPAVTAGSIAGTSITYSGRYTKIGDTVTIYFQANTGGVNDLVVASYVGFSGLPFTATTQLTASGYSTTEDIDRALGGEAQISGTILYLGPCGSGSFTLKLTLTMTYFTS
jgi:hypothetical protein